MQAANEMLLVEDDATTRELLTLLLSQEGWTVHEAEHGEAALQLLRNLVDEGTETQLPGLVLSDQKLPGIHGSDFAAAVRVLYTHPQQQPPVLLAMTATRATDCPGYDLVLTKPFPPGAVREAFEQMQRNAQTCGSTRNNPAGDISEASDDLDLAVIDEPTFLKLERSMGPERLRAMYAFALDDASSRLRNMEDALRASDVHKVGTEAHMLKGAAGMVGARRLALLAGEVEAHCVSKRNDTGMLATKLVMIAATLADIPLVLETLLAAQA